MLLAQLRHGVVGDAGQRQALAGRGEILDRRIRQRDHLAVIAELVHFLESRIEVMDLAHAAQPRGDIAEFWRYFVHLVQKTRRRDVAVKVDERVGAHVITRTGLPSRKPRMSSTTPAK